MRYQLEMDINASRERVIELFLDMDNLKEWQPSLVAIEPMGDGEPRALGGQTRQLHKMGSREVEMIEMIETITVHDPPESFAATYEADGVWNLVENTFTEVDSNNTHWVLVSEFRCTGFFLRLMTICAPWMFKKQTRDFMGYFKAYVEQKA